VVFAVLKQGFLSRIIINFRICYMISFRPRQPFHTAEISGERYAGYSLQFGIIAFGHFFIADIALRDKIIVFFQLLHFADKFSLEVFRGINICQPFFQIADVRIAAQDFKTVADFVNAVVDGF